MATIEDQWQAIPIADRDKAYRILYGLKPGEIYDIAKRISPDKREEFTTVCKYFQKWNDGITFQIEFVCNGIKKVK